jgi:hypothetical protein
MTEGLFLRLRRCPGNYQALPPATLPLAAA